MLERTLNERYPGTSLDHLEGVRTQCLDSQVPVTPSDVGQSYNYDYLAGTSPDTERIWQWQMPQTPNLPSRRMGGPVQMRDLGASQPSPPNLTQASPPDFSSQQLSSSAPRRVSIQQGQGGSTKPEGVDEIPTATAASFFRTYFQAIHPQYPFLSVKDCGDWYEEWKMAPVGNPISGWPAFFVKMVILPLYCCVII